MARHFGVPLVAANTVFIYKDIHNKFGYPVALVYLHILILLYTSSMVARSILLLWYIQNR